MKLHRIDVYLKSSNLLRRRLQGGEHAVDVGGLTDASAAKLLRPEICFVHIFCVNVIFLRDYEQHNHKR
jgi:hypothetical protein